jgi:alpha-tubulin suppressor-like RCC1 family protein
VVLDENGRVFSWGRGAWGQTGQGTTDNLCLPTRVEALDEHRIEQACTPSYISWSLILPGTGARIFIVVLNVLRFEQMPLVHLLVVINVAVCPSGQSLQQKV